MKTTLNYRTDSNHAGNRRLAAALFLSLTCLCSSSFADKIGWHEQMYLQLGDGVDLKNEQQPQTPPVIMSTNVTTLNDGQQSETVTFAQHIDDLVRSLSINSSVSLSSLVFNGNVNVSFFNQVRFDANDLDFVFTGTKTFGDMIYSVADFSQDFKDTVATLQQTLQGEALHAAITSRYGTHFVHGWQKSATVSVIYSFQSESASARQQLIADASAGYNGMFDSASFSAYVSSFFASGSTNRTISYTFYSSDPLQSPTTFGVGINGLIQNMQQFTNFIAKVEGYFNSMDPSHGKITQYIVDPIESVSGYKKLLGNYVPPTVYSADYTGFLQAYSTLQAWEQRLGAWVMNPNQMSWLNATGQQMVTSKHADVANYLAALKLIATSHFQSGTPLVVPNDVLNYLSTLNDIPLPEMYVMDSFDYGGNHYIFGRIDCGSLALTATNPFFNVSQCYMNTNKSTISIYYSPSDFANAELKALPAGYEPHILLTNLLASSQWITLSNQAVTQERTGFFVAEQPTSQAPNWSLVILNAANGTVDQLPFLSTLSGGATAAIQPTGSARVELAIMPSSGTGTVGMASAIPMQVTNTSSAQAYGTVVSFKLADNFDFGGASGSQGFASFDPANRVVSYSVGPLLGGAKADITLNLIPLQAGLAVPAGTATLRLGDGLTNSSPNIAADFASISTAPPVLNLVRVPAGVQVDWHSDTGRLLVEHTATLGNGASWSVAANPLVAAANHRFVSFPVTGTQGFFRLHSL